MKSKLDAVLEQSSPAKAAVLQHRVSKLEQAVNEISKVAPWAPKVVVAPSR